MESLVKSTKSCVSKGLEATCFTGTDVRDGGRPLGRFTGEMPSPVAEPAKALEDSPFSPTGVPVTCSERVLFCATVEVR